MAKDDTASKRLAEETAELVECLLSIMNDKDDPGLSAIDNQRRRYARILWAMGGYFEKIDHDKLSEPPLAAHCSDPAPIEIIRAVDVNVVIALRADEVIE